MLGVVHTLEINTVQYQLVTVSPRPSCRFRSIATQGPNSPRVHQLRTFTLNRQIGADRALIDIRITDTLFGYDGTQKAPGLAP